MLINMHNVKQEDSLHLSLGYKLFRLKFDMSSARRSAFTTFIPAAFLLNISLSSRNPEGCPGKRTEEFFFQMNWEKIPYFLTSS